MGNCITQDVLHLLDLLPRWFVLVLQRAAEARSGPNLKGKSTPFQKLLKFDHFLLHFLKDRTTRLFLYYFANSISLYVPSVQPLLPCCRPELLRGLGVGLKCVFFLVLFPIYILQNEYFFTESPAAAARRTSATCSGLAPLLESCREIRSKIEYNDYRAFPIFVSSECEKFPPGSAR